ncbi:mastermind-like domain-containing protein 1 isoform X1 [Neovison vison]|nr:mastermind-like domain-containing protein 1 isoform X1 [Neogale vison]XP_044091230.1 mastermind-like domain-containing protein 1 isoform X1 [Neogale vison]
MDEWKSRLVIKSMVPHFGTVGNRQEPRKLQESGPVKRRQEGDHFQFPGMADGGYPNKIKRPCLEDVTLSMGPSAHPSTACVELQVPPLTMNPSATAMGGAGHSLPLETNPMNGSVMGSPFVVPPAAEVGLKGPPGPYYDKTNSVPAVDQELQDLLEELTKIQEPSPNDLDLEKILGSKPEEPLVLEHPQATLGTTPKPPVHMPHLESLGGSKEFASSCSQLTGAGPSLQVPHSPAGISYGIPPPSKRGASPSSSVAHAKSQAPGVPQAALPPVPVPQWHHAHQLKVLAASKQGSASRPQAPSPSWSGLPPPGMSPSYRPVPSPQPPPQFSPQSLMVSCMASSNLPGSAFQASPNALLASLASSGTTALGPAMLYTPEKLPSPALSQQPQFSPQSSILANLVSSGVKSPPGHLLSALPASNAGPSPPYRPEKLSSPGLPQQSFTPQCSLIRSLTPSGHPLTQPPPPPPPPRQSTSTIFKPLTTDSSKTLSVIMQQGLPSPGPGIPEPFTFGNTKPLSHFVSEPGPQKVPSVPATSRQTSLLHYLQQAPPASSTTALSTATATLQPPPPPPQPDHSSLLLHQMMQQPQRFQRLGPRDSMPSLPRQQEKQRSGLTAMTPEQRSAYIAQQMSQFQAVQEQVTSKCSQTKARSPSSQPVMPPRAGLLQNNPNPAMIPPSRHQSHKGMDMALPTPTPGNQQGIFNPNPPFPIPSHLGQNPPGSARLQIAKAIPSEAPLLAFCPRPLGGQLPSPHQLRQPCVPRNPTVLKEATWVAAAAAGTTAVSREPPLSHTDLSIRPHLESNSIFTRTPVGSPTFPSQQAVVPPNQVAPGGRPGQKVSFGLLGNQSLRQSPVQGPVLVSSATKSLQQGMAGFGPVSPIEGIEPPSYVAAAIATSQSLGPFSRMGFPPELPPYDFLPPPQPQLNGVLSAPDCSEVDFIDALLKGPRGSPEEGWVCNLRLIDDVLEEHAAAAAAAAATAAVPQSAGGL